MGLVVGLAEFALFAFFAAVCVSLVLTLVFAALSLLIGLVGFSFDGDEETITMTTVFTMIVWAFMLVAGGVCSATGHTALWNASPFGVVQTMLWEMLRPYFLPEPHTWQTDQSGMWATFWSYCVVSLFASILIVVCYASYEHVKTNLQRPEPGA